MTPERWQEVKKALAGALERTPAERRAYLDQACADDSLRREDHHGNEQHADINQPGVRHQADTALHQRDQNRAENRTKERRRAADEGHQQSVRRQRRDVHGGGRVGVGVARQVGGLPDRRRPIGAGRLVEHDLVAVRRDGRVDEEHHDRPSEHRQWQRPLRLPSAQHPVREQRRAGRGDGGLMTAEREELNRLRRENRQLRLEREILSKAAAWFARETNAIPVKGSGS